MSTEYNKLKPWQQTQYKAFRSWVNVNLSSRKTKVANLEEDFKTGVQLDNLIEIVQKKSIGRWSKKPKVQMQKLENINIALEALKKDNIKLVNIGSTDIHEGNINLILGLIWTLILNYHINQLDFLDIEEINDKKEGNDRKPSISVKGLKKLSGKEKLLHVVNDIVEPWNLKATNFKSSFTDGKILTCLAYTRAPTKIANPKNMKGDDVKNVAAALKVLENEFGVPHVIDANDIVNHPDEKATMTLLGYAVKQLAGHDQVVFHPDQTVEGGEEVLEEGGDNVQSSNNSLPPKSSAPKSSAPKSSAPKKKKKKKKQATKQGKQEKQDDSAFETIARGVQKLPPRNVKRVRDDVKIPDEVPAPAKFPKSQLFTRFVEIGRVVLINHGKRHRYKLAVIVDVIDANSVLIHGPCTDVKRQPISTKRIMLTDIVIPIRRNSRYRAIEKVWLQSRAQEQWDRTKWAKKLSSRKRKAKMNDFDRFKVKIARTKRAKLIREKKAQLKQSK